MPRAEWFQEAIDRNAQIVREGRHGSVVAEFEFDPTTWRNNGVSQPHFVLDWQEGFVIVKATESGIFRQTPSGGWAAVKE